MYSQDACVRDILEDYLTEERNLETKIKECIEKRFKIKSDFEYEDVNVDGKNHVRIFGRIDPSESGLRNQRFLKVYQILAITDIFQKHSFHNLTPLQDLEEAKARLRTIASFTPTDQELRVLAGAYRGLLGNVARQPSSTA